MKNLIVAVLIFFIGSESAAQSQLVVDPNAELRTINSSFHSISVSGGVDLYLSQSSSEAIAVSASEEKFKNLELIDVSGASDVIIAGSIKSDVLTLKMSGASDLKGEVDAGNLILELSGASDVRLSGKADKVSIKNSGASDVKASGLITDYCDAVASGASDIEITVNKELTAKASGSSEISFHGTGIVTAIQKSGSSSVTRKG